MDIGRSFITINDEYRSSDFRKSDLWPNSRRTFGLEPVSTTVVQDQSQ
jgi:hypothetical protein